MSLLEILNKLELVVGQLLTVKKGYPVLYINHPKKTQLQSSKLYKISLGIGVLWRPMHASYDERAIKKNYYTINVKTKPNISC